MAPLLQLVGIRKSFDGALALDGASFESRAGEVHALLGENGAGKSSLMNVAAGLYAPDAGSISIGGVPIALIAVFAWSDFPIDGGLEILFLGAVEQDGNDFVFVSLLPPPGGDEAGKANGLGQSNLVIYEIWVVGIVSAPAGVMGGVRDVIVFGIDFAPMDHVPVPRRCAVPGVIKRQHLARYAGVRRRVLRESG